MDFIKGLFGWSSPTMSYHVLKDFGGGTYLWWWPISGMNQYCTVETEARLEYERITKADVEGGYRLVRYPAVTTMFGSVRGITGTPDVLDERKKSDKQ